MQSNSSANTSTLLFSFNSTPSKPSRISLRAMSKLTQNLFTGAIVVCTSQTKSLRCLTSKSSNYQNWSIFRSVFMLLLYFCLTSSVIMSSKALVSAICLFTLISSYLSYSLTSFQRLLLSPIRFLIEFTAAVTVANPFYVFLILSSTSAISFSVKNLKLLRLVNSSRNCSERFCSFLNSLQISFIWIQRNLITFCGVYEAFKHD